MTPLSNADPASHATPLSGLKVPQWLLDAPSDSRAQLRQLGIKPKPWVAPAPAEVEKLHAYYARHLVYERQLGEALAQLPSIENFAEPLLKAAIQERFGLDLDVRSTYLFHAQQVDTSTSFAQLSQDPMARLQVALKRATQPLLAAALQNFEAREAEAGGMNGPDGQSSGIFRTYPVNGILIEGDEVDITPHAFASLCRELDLGGKYQALIDSLVKPVDGPGEAEGVATANRRGLFMKAEHSAFQVQVQLAFLNGLIDEPMRDMALSVVRKGQPTAEAPLATSSFLRLWDVELTGVAMISKNRDESSSVEPVLVYLPNDPETPIKMYPSSAHFHDALRDRMLKPDYLKFFERYIPARQRSDIVKRLNAVLYPMVSSLDGSYQTIDKNAQLHLRDEQMKRGLVASVCTQKVAVLRDDGLFQAVPTAAEDRKSLIEKVEYFANTALTVLNTAVFVVPGLGEVMLAVTAGQLLYETYEGIEDLSHGEKEQAWNYLMDVAENLALMAALGAAPDLQAPELISQMRKVQMPDGSTRLWKPDITPFAHDIELPAGLKADASGLYAFQNTLWLPLDGRTFAVKASTETSTYRLEHPTRANAYAPELRHNGAGAWLHELDQPLDWQGLTLLRRLGPLAEPFSDDYLQLILETSGVHESALRHALTELASPPALLVDAMQRFGIDWELEQFLKKMDAGDTSADPLLQARLLQELPGWPQGVPVNPHVDDVVTEALRGLDEPAIKTLLGEEPGIGQIAAEVRAGQLRKRLTETAHARRDQLFAQRYAQLQASSRSEVAVVQRDFSSLPTPVVEELLRHASQEELTQLRDELRVPSRLAEEARAFVQQIRLSRAYEGLYVDSVDNPDTHKLILHTLETLPGWPGSIRIEVRDRTFTGPLLDSIGAADAAELKVLIKDGDGYLAQDADNQSLHGRDNVYGALLHVLPDQVRSALHIPEVWKAGELKDFIQEEPLLARRTLMGVLQMEPAKPASRSPMRLADGRIGYPLSGKGAMAGYISEESLLDKIRLLEFEDAFAEDILRTLSVNLTREQISARLDQLFDEQIALRNSLQPWWNALDRETSVNDVRRENRRTLEQALWQHWRATALPELGRAIPTLRLGNFYVRDFPAELPAFISERTTSLALQRVRMAFPWEDEHLGFEGQTPEVVLRHFPNLTFLEVVNSESSRDWSMDMPGQIARLMPRIETLSLSGTMLRDTRAFRTMPHLRRLDLSGNNLHFEAFDISGLTLDYLGLERTNLSHWPVALHVQAMSSIAVVSLANNRIGALPEFLMLGGTEAGPHSLVRLQGNPLQHRAITRARISEWSGSRYRFELDVPESLLPQLETIEQERTALLAALHSWNPVSEATPINLSRTRTVEELARFWHDGADNLIQPVLTLDAEAVADFPDTLPEAFFQRVRYLTVGHTTDNIDQLNQLLPRFPQLTAVSLSETPSLSSLPEVLVSLPMVEILDLSGLDLVIDQAAIDFMARMPAMSQLILDGNTIGAITDVSALAIRNRLSLELRNVGLEEWPAWLDQTTVQSMDSLVLRDNRITELPEWLLSNPHNTESHTYIDLHLNPLSRDAMTRAHLSNAYNRTYGFEMDLPEDIRELRRPRHESDGSTSESEDSDAESPETPSEPWLNGPMELSTRRGEVWQRLEDSNEAPDLLALIDGLRATADYRESASRVELIERVWHVLEAASQDPALLQTLNGMAEEPLIQMRTHTTCADGIRLEFNQMEVQVFIRQSLREVPEEQRGSSLYRLVRRLYRLDELDNAARQQTGSRDEAEVRLLYRLTWATELDLPLPPRQMLFAPVANVTRLELDQALDRVYNGETGQPFMEYAIHRDFWQAYLRDTYAERFRTLKDAFEEQVLALIDLYPGDTPEQASERILALEVQYKADELLLLQQLTEEKGREI
ncbi:NEL-type E3 ubiquitin ligase domain-containing protein [Pseudomonas sp. NPDC090202]|uniref:NEL-type E3 ubiquitin ligase domain-containing protein n=1 Tax=unclassified Pseudomonas TaxID=196821 RepID=UPI003828631B